MEEWFKLSEEDRRIAINQASIKTGLLPVAVEKNYLAMKESMFYGET